MSIDATARLMPGIPMTKDLATEIANKCDCIPGDICVDLYYVRQKFEISDRLDIYRTGEEPARRAYLILWDREIGCGTDRDMVIQPTRLTLKPEDEQVFSDFFSALGIAPAYCIEWHLGCNLA